MSSLARLGLLKSGAFLNLSGNDDDEALKQLLAAATAQAELYCNRQLVSATVTAEKAIGDGTKMLYPREYPVTSLTSFTIWDGAAHTSETVTYAEIVEQRGIHYPTLLATSATYGEWPEGDDEYNIRLTYVAGYSNTGWDTETVRMLIATLTTAPAVGDVLTQLNTAATITVTASSAAQDSITGTVSGPLRTTDLDTDTFTSNNVGATMAPTPITAERVDYVLSGSFSVPADLEYAVAYMAAMMWLEGRGSSEGRLGKAGQIATNYQATYERLEKGIGKSAMQILDNYKRLDY